MQKVFDLIDKKLEEHKVEVKGALEDLSKCQATVNQSLAKGERNLTDSQKMFILKDKITFHKACAATLLDLKENLQKESN